MATNHVDPEATRPFDLGPCRCPVDPPPHVNDSANVVTRFGFGAKGRIRHASRTAGVEAGYQVAILLGVKSWTLVLPDGKERPIDSEQVALLDEAIVVGTQDELGQVVQEGLMHALAPLLAPEEPLPKPSADRSPAGRSASGSRTRTTRPPPSSTST